MDASNFTDLDCYDMFYLFNPFPEIVMKQVIQNIIQSINNKPRKATIIYMAPNFHDLIMSTNFFPKSNVFSVKGESFITIHSNY